MALRENIIMNELVNEFKHLEKICNEIYSEQHGVTLYINEMEQESGYSTKNIVDWNKDLASLIRVRHIRNLYAHEDEVFIDYDESDIVFIKDFYHRILNGQDPLTLLRKQRENTTTKIKRKTSPENIDKYIVSEEGNSSSGELTKIIIWGAVLVVLIIILLLVIIFV